MENDTKSLMDNTFSPLDKGLKGGGGGGFNRDSYAAFQACTILCATEGSMQSYRKRRRYYFFNEIFKSLRLIF